ncbi:glutathione S-transferase 1-like [Anastrepha obliqua]|uniref:glutathione S-transferase 1-like n=1 Tax=Anastrepha ludens TaxID=28586 RepID=UPI0023B02445|nr:glutathione S-transferase 1-like [Anastrepha ludens]XP_054738992.1 glutathione S-transferase 1-like [Anastrepha obliqua]
MSVIILYGMDISSPVRACLLTLKALGLKFEFKHVNVLAGEQLTGELIKHNPQHTVPTLNDNGFWLWDSHAICAYLVDKYAKNDALYPRDLALRARVHQRLFFDASVLYMALRSISQAMFRHNISIVPREKTQGIIEGYVLIESFLEKSTYLVDDRLTIADFCCVATVSSFAGIVDLDAKKYPKLSAWMERMKKLPYYEEANGRGCKKYVDILKSRLTAIVS